MSNFDIERARLDVEHRRRFAGRRHCCAYARVRCLLSSASGPQDAGPRDEGRQSIKLRRTCAQAPVVPRLRPPSRRWRLRASAHQRGPKGTPKGCIIHFFKLASDYAHAPVSQDRSNTYPFHSPGAFATAPSAQHPKKRLANRPSRSPPSSGDDRSPIPLYPPTTDPCRLQQDTKSPGRCGRGAAAKQTSTRKHVQ